MVLKCLHPVCLQILTVLTVLVTISYGKVFDNIACNGVNRTCAQHDLRCYDMGGLVIKKAQYGYVVPQAQCGSVTTTCTNWRICCRYDKSDCLVDFTASDMSEIYKCSGLLGCATLPPPRGVAGNCSDNKDYVYSRIQHGCSNASVIINLSDKTKQEKYKNQVIIKYDKYKKSKYIGEGDEDDSDEDEDDGGNGGRHESSEMKKKEKDKKKEDKIDEGEIDLGCLCQVSFRTYVFLYQTNDDGRSLNVGNLKAESDTWYKIDDWLGFEIILPKHNVNIILRAKNQHRKIHSVTCGCYNGDAGVAVDDTRREYLKRANQTEVENFFIPQDDDGSSKEPVDSGVGEENEGDGNGEENEDDGSGKGTEDGGNGEEKEDGGNDPPSITSLGRVGIAIGFGVCLLVLGITVVLFWNRNGQNICFKKMNGEETAVNDTVSHNTGLDSITLPDTPHVYDSITLPDTPHVYDSITLPDTPQIDDRVGPVNLAHIHTSPHSDDDGYLIPIRTHPGLHT